MLFLLSENLKSFFFNSTDNRFNYELWKKGLGAIMNQQHSCEILVENEVPKFKKQRSCEILVENEVPKFKKQCSCEILLERCFHIRI